ncbi:putative lipid II flippase FtsW [Nocardioides bruguierae]|uniref:Probable peptidoglycan glycosyltransferase FtsW n=1 Tax=Nocardioides bruguierae TaxID=2945102 RepID=A0A9X2DA58_9ACTN|nr:putative lipid II flippase FtsW [Nocardioides bruguierae]MCM0621617.1 putative lipid II flippase FtsW [Nocardioides bruguierae]
MSSTADDTRLVPAPRGERTGLLRSVRETVADALARPLTPYYLLLGAAALLLVIGVIMVASASSVYSYKYNGGDSYAVVKRQIMWLAIALPLAWVASRLPIGFYKRVAPLAFALGCLLLVATIFLGVTVNGNRNWLPVGPIRIQPAELTKLALILWAATVYAHKERRLDSLHHLFVPVVPGAALATLLVILGRDLGTALVFFAILLGLLWVVGAPFRYFGIALSVVAAGALYLATVDTERMARLLNFVDPFQDFHDTGWQPAHGLYALASGNVLGEGIGHSIQKWGDLPEAHTDFIFAVLGEELGLIGTLLVVGLFVVIAWAALRVAATAVDPFIRYATFGIVVWLLGQTVINIGMVLALLPVIGIPLPLISYGGSSLVPSLAALGLVVGFARREPAAAAALAARKAARKGTPVPETGPHPGPHPGARA